MWPAKAGHITRLTQAVRSGGINRRFPREYMRIHGYDDDYELRGPIRSRTGSVQNLDQHRQVANSVPPPLAYAVGSQIERYLSEQDI
ncbi:MAG: DNA cytosine methyltransferase [Coriobacteriales bacterium]|nr:DNA cytosine methyltransferase [Coriobacteriales bacterium]